MRAIKESVFTWRRLTVHGWFRVTEWVFEYSDGTVETVTKKEPV